MVNYYRTTGEAVMEKKCTNGALGRLCWNSRILEEYWGGCARIHIVEYYMSSWKLYWHCMVQ